MITVDSGIKSVAYFMVVSRPAIAGYDTSSMIESARDLTILARLLLFLILIIGNIVFMNFMIMVAVSGSYENCMERKTQLINWTKLEMIEECESFMLDWFFNITKEDWFPKFIIIRRE